MIFCDSALEAVGAIESGEAVWCHSMAATPVVLLEALVALARALQALGRGDGASRLLDDVRKRIVRIDLRRPWGHPLFSPGRAWAYVASGSSRAG